jgi:PAS domain S-box-containing protein
MRIFHKGLILVGTPLLLGLCLSTSLFALMDKAEGERIKEAHARKSVSLLAGEMIAFSELVCLMFVSMHGSSDKVSAQYKNDVDELASKWQALDEMIKLGQVKVMTPERTAFFRRYTDDAIRFFKSRLDADGKLIAPSEDVAGTLSEIDIDSQINGMKKSLGLPAPSETENGSVSSQKDGEMKKSEFAASFKDCTRLSNELKSLVVAGDYLTKKFQDDYDLTNRQQTNIVCLALVFNLVMGVCLAVFYRSSILQRLRVIARNTELLATGFLLLPALKGNDEIAQLDRSFHDMHLQIQRASENEKNLFNNATDVICVLDSEDRFVRINPASRRNWEYEPDDLSDCALSTIIPGTDLPAVQDSIRRARESEKQVVFEASITTKAGKKRVSLWSAYWSKTDSNLYCIVHDITERKRIETMRSEFVRLMSYDLKQPLSRIAGNLSLILESVPSLSKSGSDKFAGAGRNVQRLIGLVDDLLQVASLDSGLLQIKPTETDLKEILSRACQEVEMLAREKKLSLQVETVTAEPVCLDPDRIMQVMVNLLSNAIKFSPEGKSITVSAERQGDQVVCRVSDQGRGVPAAQQKLIFERFAQVERADGKRKAGTGLGLPICKQIVEAHGGQIGVVSGEGEGSSFWFSLPCRVMSASDAASAAPAENGNAGATQDAAAPAAGIGPSSAKPASAGLRLSLAQMGIILVGIPVLFEFIFAGSLIWSLLALQNERRQEQRQRQVAFSACEMVSLITTKSALNVSRQFIPNRLFKIVEINRQWYETQRHLSELIKGDREAEKYFEKLDRAAEFFMERPEGTPRSSHGETFSPGSASFMVQQLSEGMKMARATVVVMRSLARIISHAEAVEFLSPEKELSLRNREKTMLAAGLAANLVVSLLLAAQFSLGFSRRLAIMVDNTGRLALEETLNPKIPGNDELSDLDDSFHKQSALLVESRRKERAVFDNSRDVICTVSPEGIFVSVNPAAESMWGYGRKELQQSSIFDLVIKEERETTRLTLLAALDGDRELVHECRMEKADGKIINCLWSASAKKEQNALFCIVRDITDKKELERLRQEFLALVSHDLRTPLTAISVVAELAQESVFGALTPAAAEMLAEIRSDAGSLLELINDILDLEKLEAGKLELALEDTGLSELSAELAKQVAGLPADRVNLSGEFLERKFKADFERLSRAIASVCKFMLLGAADPESLFIAARHERSGVTMKIIDSGPALPESLAGQIFERFKDIGADTKETDSSLHADLRLPLAARIIECHGGRIHFEKSNEGGNICCIFIKPAGILSEETSQA